MGETAMMWIIILYTDDEGAQKLLDQTSPGNFQVKINKIAIKKYSVLSRLYIVFRLSVFLL